MATNGQDGNDYNLKTLDQLFQVPHLCSAKIVKKTISANPGLNIDQGF